MRLKVTGDSGTLTLVMDILFVIPLKIVIISHSSIVSVVPAITIIKLS